MRLSALLVTMLLMVVVAGTPVSAQESDSDATYWGFVTDVSRSAEVVTVEKMISGSPGPKKGEFAVDKGTEIFRERGGELVKVSFEDLAIAQSVEVSYSGSSGGSEPIETVAEEIVILSGPLGGVPSNSQNQYSVPPADSDLRGQYEDSFSNGGNSGDSGPTMDDLPDTGGAPLAVLAAVAVVVSGGLLLRRASR